MNLPAPDPADTPARTAGVTLGVDHETAYRYDSPVELAHHLGYLRPLSDACQVVEDYALSVTPAPSDIIETLDGFGNTRCTFAPVSYTHLTLPTKA